MLVEYTAKRSLKSGHTVDLVYDFELELAQQDRSRSTVGKRNIALDGTTVDTVNRRDVIYDFATTPIGDSDTPDNDDLIEFLDSVMSGETFTLDEPAVDTDYILDNPRRPYTQTRVGPNLFTYRFRVRAV